MCMPWIARCSVFQFLALSLAVVQASLFPQPTQTGDAVESYLGISPLPTDPPFMMGLASEEDRRSLIARENDPGVCAYLGGIRASSLTCVPGYSCAVGKSQPVAGCCPGAGACYLATTCVPYASMAYCDGACLNNPMMFKCGNVAFPYCYTLEVDHATSTYYQYTCWTAPGTITALGSYTDGPQGGDNAAPPPKTVTASASALPAETTGDGDSNNNQNNNNININMATGNIGGNNVNVNKPSGGESWRFNVWLGLGSVFGVVLSVIYI